MKNKPNNSLKLLFILLIIATLGLISCTRDAEGLPRVWIDSPRPGTTIPVGQPVIVYSHAFASSGVAEVVLSVDGEAYQRSAAADTEIDFSDFEHEWLPPGAGTYILQLVAYDSEGERSSPATISITIGTELAVEDPEDQGDETEDTEDLKDCPPLATANTNSFCRSGPGEKYGTTGALSSGESAQVMGRSENGNWWVINQPGDSGTCWIWKDLVDVLPDTCVVAVVEAPSPPAEEDLEPPPAPVLVVPADGIVLDCRSFQNLAWLPVEDPSGIKGYYLLVKKEISPGSWQNVNEWGPIAGKQQEIGVECGLNFRWSVRAEDQAGNLGPWSSSSTFTVNLE
jgi:hypothetical protein